MGKKNVVQAKSDNTFNVFALNTKNAADFIGCSEALLRKFRSEGNGPVYSTIGSKIVYPILELKRYLKARLVK